VVRLLQIFAVGLFNATREALERQTATAKILNVIASSPTDAQPVSDAIVEVPGGKYRSPLERRPKFPWRPRTFQSLC
jgi:hypothetical protein